MSKQCEICIEIVNRENPGIQCGASCDRFFHGKCVGLNNKQLDSLRMDGISWSCPDCRSLGATAGSRRSLAPPSGIPSPPTTRFLSTTNESVSNSDLMDAMKGIYSELKEIKEQHISLTNSVTFCSDKVSDFEEKLNRITEWMRATDKILKQNATLQESVESLESRLDRLEQSARVNNVEIQGIDEKPSENLLDVVQKIGDYIDFNVVPEKVQHIHRIQSKNPKNKTKSIILQFSNRKYKEDFLAAAKRKRMRRDDGSPRMQIAGLSEGFYINEHLTLSNKILFRETRTVAKNKQYKYTWVKDGMIFVRRDDTSRIIHIKSIDVLKNL